MADKKKQSPATLEGLSDLLISHTNEIKDQYEKLTVQYEQVIFKLESVLTRHNSSKVPKVSKEPKKPVVKKESKKEPSKEYTNTMHWWAGMYVTNDQSIKKYFTQEDVEAAEKSLPDIKDMPNKNDRDRAISLKIWHKFTKSKKTGELKTMFENWKKDRAKNQAADVERETHTDEESNQNEKKKEIDTDDDDE